MEKGLQKKLILMVGGDIRHKALTDIEKAGINFTHVGRAAGHSDPRTTKRYTHFSIEETKNHWMFWQASVLNEGFK